jgi:predicted porin
MRNTSAPPVTALIVLATALASTQAGAQSNVTIYGAIDAGVLWQNNAGPGQSTTSILNGGTVPSILGFKGAEDLGSGLKAVFNLEAHLYADTGQADARLFRRQSNVGFASDDYGTVLIGNQYSPALLAFASTDPRSAKEAFSGLYAWAYNSGALTTGNNTNNDVGVFIQNAVSYSKKIGAAGIAVGYSVSEQRGAVRSLGLTWTDAFLLSATVQQTNAPNSARRQSSLYSAGVGYVWGAFTAKANFLRGRNDNVAGIETSKVNVAAAGLAWQSSASNTVAGSVYFGKDKNHGQDKTTTFILADEYALSKRTVVYAQAVYARARDQATLLTSVVGGGTRPGESTSLLNLGLRHAF